jgi:hypothetical protein
MKRLARKDLSPALRVFKMPAVQSVKTRKTSITNAFVSVIIPVVVPTEAEILEALSILGMTPQTIQCIYCGDKCNAWDHLRPIVVDRRPTGYISEIANLVPACQPCNSSKGNRNWRTWMSGTAPNSPNSRHVRDVSRRIEQLDAFEKWRTPTLVDFEAIVGTEAYAAYWRELDRIVQEMETSQKMGQTLRDQIAAASDRWQMRPIVTTPAKCEPPSQDG